MGDAFRVSRARAALSWDSVMAAAAGAAMLSEASGDAVAAAWVRHAEDLAMNMSGVSRERSPAVVEWVLRNKPWDEWNSE